MQPEEMCRNCIHNCYCIGAFKKKEWCGNYTREKSIKKIRKDKRISKS